MKAYHLVKDLVKFDRPIFHGPSQAGDERSCNSSYDSQQHPLTTMDDPSRRDPPLLLVEWDICQSLLEPNFFTPENPFALSRSASCAHIFRPFPETTHISQMVQGLVSSQLKRIRKHKRTPTLSPDYSSAHTALHSTPFTPHHSTKPNSN